MTKLNKYTPQQWDEFINRVADGLSPNGDIDLSRSECMVCQCFRDEYGMISCQECFGWRKPEWDDVGFYCVIAPTESRVDNLIERLYAEGVFDEQSE